MQHTTEIGLNHTGLEVAPEVANRMMENTDLTKPPRGDQRAAAKLRAQYAAEADPVGSMPDPGLTGGEALLMDKLGERLAFERSGTRLYEALMVKCEAAKAFIPLNDLQHIRDEEHTHFALDGAAIQSLGGDPTAQTPSANVTGVEGMGLLQVQTDPKTTVQTTWGQCVVVVLVALVEMLLRLHESVYAPLYALFLVGPAANLIEIWWHARQSTGASASTPDLLA